jgi:hypothetical protein
MYTARPDHIEFNGMVIPIEALNADYRAFLAWVAEGNVPSLPSQPTHAQLWERAIAEMRALRQPILDVLDGLQASALVLDNADRAQVIETAKQGLRDITKLNLASCATYDEMRLMVGAAYAALAASLPPDIRQSFKEATL